MPSDNAPAPVGRTARDLPLVRTRVGAFRVYAILVVIIGHSELLLGHAAEGHVNSLRWALNVVSRFAVPLFFTMVGEHLGPRLLRDRRVLVGRSYAGRMARLLVAASVVYWLVDLAKIGRRHGFGAVPILLDRHFSDPLHVALYGARWHFWFLTVLIVVVLGVSLVLARRRVRTLAAGSVLLYGLGLLFGPYAPVTGLPIGHTWLQALLQAPLFFTVGLVLGLERRHPRRLALTWTLIVGGLVLHAAEVYWLSTTYDILPQHLPMLIGTVPYAIGVALLAFAPGSHRVDRWAARYSGSVPLVYLGHVLFLELLLPPPGQFPDLAVRVLLPLLTTLLSFAAAGAINRWRRRGRRSRPAVVEPV